MRGLVSVVDDDVSMRESLPDLMRQLGFEAQAFSSAEEFLASNHASQTRCLIVDVGLPRMSGLELVAELTRRGQRISTIFITARAGCHCLPREAFHRAGSARGHCDCG